MVIYREFTLRLMNVRSLKEKRSVRQRTIHRIQNKYKMSCAEVNTMDSLTFLTLGVAAVANDGIFLERQMQIVEEYLDTQNEFLLYSIERE